MENEVENKENVNLHSEVSKISKQEIELIRAREDALNYLENLKNDKYFLKQCEKYLEMTEDDK